MSLRLMRVAVVSVDDPPRELDALDLVLGEVTVATGPNVVQSGRPMGTVVVASIHLENSIVWPVSSLQDFAPGREVAEYALETLARLLALQYRCSYTISSPMPFLGLSAETGEDLVAVEGLAFAEPLIRSINPARGESGILEQGVIKHLWDRLDGVALLAESLTHKNALGRYSQLLRLFERAFRLGPHNLTLPLTSFLGATPHNFRPEEVAGWTALRAEALHADRRPHFYLEGDVRQVVPRMEEAAFDVLMNKAEWRAPSPQRRQVWQARSGSTGDPGGLYLTAGMGATLSFEMLDGFGSYPLMLASTIDAILPDALWLYGDARGGRFERRRSSRLSPPDE